MRWHEANMREDKIRLGKTDEISNEIKQETKQEMRHKRSDKMRLQLKERKK